MIEVARAEEEHIREIGKLWWEFMEFHRVTDPVFTPREGAVPGLEDHVRQLIKSEDAIALAVVGGETVVGFSPSEIRSPSVACAGGSRGYIDTVAVTAGYRRRGVGQKLVTETLRWFGSRGIRRVELETAAANGVANGFWRKQGFEVYRHRLDREIG
jgi:ribosomal protein S18 acetylase RimI-like enzyme